MRFALKVAACVALVLAGPLGTRAAWAQDTDHQVEAAADAAVNAETGESGPNPLAIDPDLAIWTLVVFLVMFAILKTFAWPQIAAAVDERERNIAGTIDAANAKLEEAKRILADHEAKLAATAGEVKEMLDEARRDAEVVKKRIEEDGRKAAADEVARGRVEIKRAKDEALQDLAVTSAKLAIELGERVVRDQLQISPEHQARIVRDALDKLAAAAPSRN
ncbi:MAG: ATP synthase F0 subunit B [Pirellulales bacterium]